MHLVLLNYSTIIGVWPVVNDCYGNRHWTCPPVVISANHLRWGLYPHVFVAGPNK